MKNELTIHGLNENIAYCEAIGISKCFEAYANYFSGDTIFEVGFNHNSGYVYICLEEHRVTICSMLGRAVEYLVTDFDSGEETFFDNYQDAVSSQELLNAM
jgi:hypothetical protein